MESANPRTIKTLRIPMPVDTKRLRETVLLILDLPSVMELRIALLGIEVQRYVEEGEPIVPQTILDIAKGLEPEAPEAEFLLKHLKLEALDSDPDRHPLTTLIEMAERVRNEGLYTSAWYVARGDSLDSFLAQPTGTLPAYLLGLPVYYVQEDQVPEGKLLLVGSSTRHSIDSTYGVTADIGG